MKITKLGAAGVAAVAVLFGTVTADAETHVTYKSAKSTSSYYQMAVQIAEAVKRGTGGAMILTVEESQGSVQNVKEAAVRPGNYVFTTPPSLIGLAQGGKKMFEPKNPKFDEIRGLFPIPSLTMHFVVRADSGIKTFADLAGKSYLIGKGSFGAKEAEKYFEMFGIKDKVKLVDVELNAAVAALKNKQVDGFATAGSYPAPNVMEAAAGTAIHLISMTDEQVAESKRTKLVIPGGTYPGVDQDTVTTSLSVMAYTTTGMSDDDAYTLTKTYWSEKARMGADNKWWGGVKPEMLSEMTGKLHPGALKYYAEANISVPDALK
jgi:TRAP transporter TAXI family solute receptor